jgi:hypothetical protein
MAESALRRLKKAVQHARWNGMTPEQRVRQAGEMVAAAIAMRAAGLARLGFTQTEIRRIERSRGR